MSIASGDMLRLTTIHFRVILALGSPLPNQTAPLSFKENDTYNPCQKYPIAGFWKQWLCLHLGGKPFGFVRGEDSRQDLPNLCLLRKTHQKPFSYLSVSLLLITYLSLSLTRFNDVYLILFRFFDFGKNPHTIQRITC